MSSDGSGPAPLQRPRLHSLEPPEIIIRARSQRLRFERQMVAALAQRDQAKIAFEKAVTQLSAKFPARFPLINSLLRLTSSSSPRSKLIANQFASRPSATTVNSRTISTSLTRKFRCIRPRAFRLRTTLAENWPLSTFIRLSVEDGSSAAHSGPARVQRQVPLRLHLPDISSD